MLNIITSVTPYKNKLAIGRNGDLLFNLKDDIKFFKEITKNSLNKKSLLDRNIVLMGRKTFFSIPQKYRPLSNRINIVLTRDKTLIKLSPIPQNLILTKDLYYTDILTFNKIYEKYNPNVFIIGGSSLYNLFIEKADKLYITHILDIQGKDIKFKNNQEPDTFINHFTSIFKLVGFSEKYIQTDISYRFLFYNKTSILSDEYQYLGLMKNILNNGHFRHDRTGTGTISVFGTQMRFDISNGVLPLLTTKRVPLKAIIEELLFFCRGDTNSKILEKKGVMIWSDNTSREFLDNRGLEYYPDGCMGPMYGWSWRNFGAKYSAAFSDTSTCDISLIGGFDQLKHVEHLLKTDPFSRRIYISNLNPAETSKMCLDMCHTYIQFYVEEINGIKFLSGYFTMRSNDFLLGNPFNYISYSLLIYILAKRCDMKPKEIIYNGVDCHIYTNHISQVKQQLTRTPRPFPHIKLNDSLKTKDWSQIDYSDFDLIGYFPYPAIKAPMAI